VHLALSLALLASALATTSAEIPSTHTVRAGETVSAIARQHGTTAKAILQANPGLNPSRIHAGDKIRLPSSSSTAKSAPPSGSSLPPSTSKPAPASGSAVQKTWIKIQKGDTLSKIARENAVKVEDLRKWNRLSGDTIRPGDLLRIRPATAEANKPATAPSPPKPKVPDDRFLRPVRSQIDGPKNRLRDWEYIVIHHSGTSGGSAQVFDSYHREERGMENGMAYHFVIGNGTDSGDGQIEVGNRWRQQLQGGHLASEALNEIAIGICLVGDFSRSRLGPRQTAALIELVQYLRRMMPENRLKFRLHREINTRPTECPGRLFPGQAIREIINQPVRD
jgi:LysM repeat protein